MRRLSGIINKNITTQGELLSDVFAKIKGRGFDYWVDFDSRDNGYDEDDLIENPAYIVESLLRDEIFTERDLTITDSVSSYVKEINGLVSSEDDYYNGAVLHNLTVGSSVVIADYDGATKRVTLAEADATNDDDKVFITNIQGNNKIDTTTFDLVGNTINGLRKDWKFAKSVYQEGFAETLFSELLYESRCILFTSFDKYKLVAIDSTPTEVATWTKPLMQGGKLLANASLSPIRQLLNEYRINYAYDYASGQHNKTLFVNKSGASSELTNGATYQATCKTLFDNYKIINRFEYNCNWIYDSATAELFFNKIFEWYSKQRLIVNWATPVSNYLQYEVGDIIKLNNADIIPTGINNVSKFMIMENPLKPLPGAPFINFKLVEIS